MDNHEFSTAFFAKLGMQKKTLKNYVANFKQHFDFHSDKTLEEFCIIVERDIIGRPVPKRRLKALLGKEIQRTHAELRAESPQTDIMNDYRPINEDQIMIEIDAMDGHKFEEFVQSLMRKEGYDVTRSKLSADQGADLVAIKDGRRYVVQVKKRTLTERISNKAVQEVVASKEIYDCNDAIVVTNTFYHKSARELANANNVELWDRRKLIELMRNSSV